MTVRANSLTLSATPDFCWESELEPWPTIRTYATLRGANDFFLRETLDLSAFIIYDGNNDLWTFRPAIDYDYNDALTLSAGVDFILGKNDETNTDEEQISIEVKYSF